MNTKKMEVLYNDIAMQLINIIPIEWSKLYLYAEVLDDSTSGFFYFKPSDKNEYVYSHYIPSLYNSNEKSYYDMLRKLYDSLRELRNEFKTNKQEAWTSVTIILERTGKIKIQYDYEDIQVSSLSFTKRQMVWTYKNLGILPSHPNDIKFLEEYIKNQKV